jgi:hypothetical protein
MIFFKYLSHTYQGADHTGRRVFNMGGGGGGHTTSTVTQSNIPDWLRPQTEALLGAGTQEYFNTEFDPETGAYNITGTKPYTPYSTDPRDYIAQFSPQQQQVFTEAAGMQTPGGFQTGQQMTGMAGMGGLDTAGQALGYGAQAAGMGGMYEQMATDPRSMQAYMSPYMQNVVEIQKQAAIEDAQRAQLGANLGAARQGTYGGARQTLAQTQREAGLNKQLSDIQGQGLQSAFDQAQRSQQFGVTTGLQGLQTGLQGVQGAQTGYGIVGQMGAQAANIGSQRQQADLARLGFQGQMGDIQQQQQQQIINQAIQDYALSQEMPMQRLAGFNALLRGYATPTTTTQQYQAQPSGLQQLAGLGTTAAGIGTIAGAGRKEGGVIKLAKGGITDVDALESMAEDLSIPQIQQSMQNETLPKYVGMPILEQKVNEAERMKMAQTMMGQQQGQQQSISDALMAKADQIQGAQPVMAAGGGIVAFQAGGLSLSDVMRQATLQEQRDYQRTGVLSARLQNLMAGQTMPPKGSGKAGIEAILAEAEAGRGPNVQRVPDDPTERNKVLQGVEDYRRDMNKAMGITDIVPPPAAPAAAPQTAPPPPVEQKTDMATLLAEREAQQKAFIGEDPSIKKMRESLAKQGEDTLLNRMLRGSQMVFAGEQLRTRGDASGLEKVIAGEAKRAESAAEREARLAELEGADYRRRADIYKEVAGEERKKADTKAERAFQEKLVRLRSSLEPRDFNNRLLDMAQGKAGSESDQAFARKLLEGKVGSRGMTDNQMALIRSRGIVNAQKKLVTDLRYARAKTLEDKAKVQEIIEQEEINKLLGSAGVGSGESFTPSAQQQSILDKYR